MQTFEFLPPTPDFDKGGLRAYRGDLLGLLHLFLLSMKHAWGHLPSESMSHGQRTAFVRLAVAFFSRFSCLLSPLRWSILEQRSISKQRRHTLWRTGRKRHRQ